MKKIKVLHIIEDLENRGAQRQLVYMVKGLRNCGYEVTVCCLRPGGELLLELQSAGIRVCQFNKNGRVDLSLLWNLIQFMRRERFNIVHTHVFTANLWGRLAACFSNAPVIISHEHGSFTLTSKFRLVANRVLEPFTDLSFVVSQELVQRFSAENKISKQKLQLLHNGLDLAKLNGQVSDIKPLFENVYPVIGTVGALEPRKDHETFVYAARLLLKKYPGAQFVIVGDGERRGIIEDTIHRMGLRAHVHLLGKRQDVFAILKLLHVFVLPSLTEGTSIALLEAMAAGVPVVATSVGGNPEVLEWGRFGNLVPPLNPMALAQSIDSLLCDSDSGWSSHAKAREYVFRKYNIKNTIDALHRTYKNLLLQKKVGVRT